MPVALRKCRHGTMLFIPNDIYMGRMLTEYGEYSEGEVDLFRAILNPDDVVVEAGANIGCHTVPLAQIVGSGGRVVASEPQRLLYYLLCGNIALNGLSRRVVAMPAAFGAEPTTSVIAVPDLDAEINFGGISLGGGEGEPVPILAIDGLQMKRLDLIKADVEGMEIEVLRGARRAIEEFQPYLYVEADRRDRRYSLLKLMRDLGYRLFNHLPRYLPEGNTMFPEMRSINVLGVPLGRIVPSVSDLTEVEV